ncbi:MAG: hypothetical protein LBR68_03450 [Lachnoclostridium sp.]|jgi:hypothetical protein|nr:hypothetical protein [Lachnoclostridium sp.]
MKKKNIISLIMFFFFPIYKVDILMACLFAGTMASFVHGCTKGQDIMNNKATYKEVKL